MSLQVVAGSALIVLPLLFNFSFGMLAKNFDYPDILRESTSVVLQKFNGGGTSLVLTWWVFMLSAVLFAPVSLTTVVVLDESLGWLSILSVVLGALSAIVQFLGLVRWPFVIPYLARESANASEARAEVIDVVFQVLNRYLGVGVGEHLGYAFTGSWTVAVSSLVLQSSDINAVFGISGIVVGLVLLMCSFEFVGSHEQNGWKIAAILTPITYVLWSVWLVILGIFFLIGFN